MQLTNATILVTGGSSGLGAACVKRFSQQGARIIIADLNAEAGESLAEELGEQVSFVSTDVTSPDSVKQALELAVAGGGVLRGVVNCAGILSASRVLTRQSPHDLDMFSKVVQVNLIGTFNVCRLAAEAMTGNEPMADGERGVLINTSSVAAFEGQLGQAAYSASKGGVASMTLPLARELGKFGIRVVAIAPGVFLTPMMADAPDAVRESLEAQCIFPQRLGAPEEYAAMAEHILANPMLNGTVVRLDGAIRMQPK